MQWTDDFPKQAGWYWLRRPKFGEEIVRVEDDGYEVSVWNGDFCYENLDQSQWAGPIPSPTEPD